MNLDFNKAAESKPSNYVSKLRPGIHDNIFISSIQGIEPDGGSPYIEMKFVAENGTGQHTEKLYMTPAAMPYSLSKIKDLAGACGVTLPDNADVAKIEAMLSGRKVAILLHGEEKSIVNGDDKGKVIVQSHLGPAPFCSPAGEFSVLTNRWNADRAIKKLPQATQATQEKGNDLPWDK